MSAYATAMKNLYLAGKITLAQLEKAKTLDYITSEEFEKIKALKEEE